MSKVKKDLINKTVNIKNRQAFFHYSIEDTFIAGLALLGTEIKSIRMNSVNFAEGYCFFDHGNLYVKGLQISPYKQASFSNHDPLRDKKLLLKKKELEKLERKSSEKGYSIIPLRVFINERGFAKLEIGLGKGKKLFDKRETIKERDLKREIS